LSQSALFVITASTLTRSQASLSRIKVAVVLEPEEQAVNTSAAESQAGYRFTVLPSSQSQRRLESPPSPRKPNSSRQGNARVSRRSRGPRYGLLVGCARRRIGRD
jgi:hypothetical protein